MILSGRLTQEAPEMLASSAFRERFDAKGRLTSAVKDLPIWAIVNPVSSLVGLARAVSDNLAPTQAAVRTRRASRATPRRHRA